MSVTDDLLHHAETYAAGFTRGDLPMPPALPVAVVACMDARLNPYGLLGLSEGDAHVIRNAGGVITDDEIRSLVISQRLLGTRDRISSSVITPPALRMTWASPSLSPSSP